MFAYISLNNVLDWLIKDVIYFIPIMLMLARYNSFLVGHKKSIIDVIVDGQFCIIPFCMSMESILSLLKKWHKIGENMKWLGTIIMVCLLVMAITLLLLYWDLSYASVQKEYSILSKDKKTMMNLILIMLASIFFLSFFIDVIICPIK